jgi:hypothetical protein
MCEEIDKYSEEVFGIKAGDITRAPWQILSECVLVPIRTSITGRR